MTSREITTQSESSIDFEKVKRDLSFIKSLQGLAQQNQWRIVVSGGYGLDILLGKITRSHNDVDVILYGNVNRRSAIEVILAKLAQLIDTPNISTKEEAFFTDIDVNSSGLGANIYFVETVEDPNVDIHRVRKVDGEVVANSEERFPSPVIGKLDGLEIEAQNPNTHLADIIFKRRKQENRAIHDQDLDNLRLITNPDIVERIIKLMEQ